VRMQRNQKQQQEQSAKYAQETIGAFEIHGAILHDRGEIAKRFVKAGLFIGRTGRQ
jgi:hypothetical protein